MSSPSPTFCILPWLHAHVWADGSVWPCCLAEFAAGPVTSTHDHADLDGIVNHAGFRALRQRMLAGEASGHCTRCYAMEAAGGSSMRTDSNRLYAGDVAAAVAGTAPDGTVADFTLRYLDIRFSNLCNLACVTCSPLFSSHLYDVHKAMGEHLPPRKVLNLDLYERLEPYLGGVTNVNFAGGEPLLMAEHWRILDHWISTGNTGVCINTTSNLTRLDWKGRRVTEVWRHFPRVTVLASLDDVGPGLGRIRRGAEWEVIAANLRSIRAEAPHVRLVISPTVSALNAARLFPMIRQVWAACGIPPADWQLNILQHPEHLSARTLGLAEKTAVHAAHAEHLAWAGAEGLAVPDDQYRAFLTYLDGEAAPGLDAQRDRFLAAFDRAHAEVHGA